VIIRPDFSVIGLEVTQAIQDMSNSVTLIAGKRTYVRAHVQAGLLGGTGHVKGEFVIKYGTAFTSQVGPIPAGNPGGKITVKVAPDRGKVNDSFWVELPPETLSGGWKEIRFTVNPDHSVTETNYGNNSATALVTLMNSPPMKVKIHNIIYEANGSWHSASIQDLLFMVSWLRRAYPVPSVNWQLFGAYWPLNTPPSDHGCTVVNTWLAWHRILDGSPAQWRYYGMVTDTGGWMRGCAKDIPSWVASGPTGAGGWGWNAWDTDGSYGDWYGSHELGHTYGRYHALCSGSEGGPDLAYPYPGGLIGIPGDPNTFYGWDIESQEVYPPTWSDIMSYCPDQWISDYTYHALRDRIAWEAGSSSSSARPRVTLSDYLAVFGVANVTQGTAELNALYRLPEITDPEPQVPSEDWALVLYGPAGEALASYPFTPKPDTSWEEGEDLIGAIDEAVPWVSDTALIAVEHRGARVASRAVSANQPTVTLAYPNGGESLGGSVATARWEGFDDDGDDLTYTLLFSPDAGSNWTTITSRVNGSEFDLPLDELPGTDQGRLRVIVSDGVHTGEDQSDGTFSVERKAPQALIVSPDDGSRYTLGQQVTLIGEGYDIEDGILEDAALSWSSDLQADLGTGRHLAVTDLYTGTHELTLRVADSDGQVSTTSTTILVYVQQHHVVLPLVVKS